MTAPLRLSPSQVSSLGAFLEMISKATRERNVRLGAHGRIDVEINGGDAPGGVVGIEWDGDRNEYVVSDQVGN